MIRKDFLRFFGIWKAANTKVVRRCDSCEFGKRSAGGFIECRRHAPSVAPTPEYYQYNHPVRKFPTMSGHDWCGDWEPMLPGDGEDRA